MVVHELLSEKGKRISFPKDGILSQSKEAKGRKINATIGMAAEDDGDIVCLDCIKKNILLDSKDVFPYVSSFGKLGLRDRWLELMKEKNPGLKDVSLPVVTGGLTHGLSILGYLFVDEGDEIILGNKFWGNYRLIFEKGFKAKLNAFNLFKDGGFDLESFEEELNKDGVKKIILFNFPNNPSGYTVTEEELKSIVEIVRRAVLNGKKILAIFDDAYFGLVYKEGVCRESLFSCFSDLHENVFCVKVDGATKEDYVWGFRVGFLTYGGKCVGREVFEMLEDKTAGVIRGSVSNVSHVGQSLILDAINSLEYKKEKEEKFNLLKGRFEEVVRVLKDEKYLEFFKALPFNSGYFMCVELRDGLDAEKVRKDLLDRDVGVIVTGGLLRIAFSSVSKENISRLFDEIYEVCRFNFSRE